MWQGHVWLSWKFFQHRYLWLCINYNDSAQSAVHTIIPRYFLATFFIWRKKSRFLSNIAKFSGKGAPEEDNKIPHFSHYKSITQKIYIKRSDGMHMFEFEVDQSHRSAIWGYTLFIDPTKLPTTRSCSKLIRSMVKTNLRLNNLVSPIPNRKCHLKYI